MRAKLLKVHTHDGKRCAVGDVIELDQAEYEWLVDLKVVVYEAAEVAEVPAESSATISATSGYIAPTKRKGWGNSPIASAAPTESNEAPVI